MAITYQESRIAIGSNTAQALQRQEEKMVTYSVFRGVKGAQLNHTLVGAESDLQHPKAKLVSVSRLQMELGLYTLTQLRHSVLGSGQRELDELYPVQVESGGVEWSCEKHLLKCSSKEMFWISYDDYWRDIGTCGKDFHYCLKLLSYYPGSRLDCKGCNIPRHKYRMCCGYLCALMDRSGCQEISFRFRNEIEPNSEVEILPEDQVDEILVEGNDNDPSGSLYHEQFHDLGKSGKQFEKENRMKVQKKRRNRKTLQKANDLIPPLTEQHQRSMRERKRYEKYMKKIQIDPFPEENIEINLDIEDNLEEYTLAYHMNAFPSQCRCNDESAVQSEFIMSLGFLKSLYAKAVVYESKLPSSKMLDFLFQMNQKYMTENRRVCANCRMRVVYLNAMLSRFTVHYQRIQQLTHLQRLEVMVNVQPALKSIREVLNWFTSRKFRRIFDKISKKQNFEEIMGAPIVFYEEYLKQYVKDYMPELDGYCYSLTQLGTIVDERLSRYGISSNVSMRDTGWLEEYEEEVREAGVSFHDSLLNYDYFVQILTMQNEILKLHHKPTVKVPYSPEKFEEILRKEIIYPQSPTDMVSEVIKAIQGKLQSWKIKLAYSVISTIATNLICIIALLRSTWYTGSSFNAIAIFCSILNLVTVIYQAFDLAFDKDMHGFVENISRVVFNQYIDSSNIPKIEGATDEEIKKAFSSEDDIHQQGPEEMEETSADVLKAFGILRNHLRTPEKDPVMIAVNGVSWIISITAICTVKAFGIDLRSAVTHLTFLKYARELQQQLSRDVKDITNWVRSIWKRPKETSYKLLANRLARCQELLSYVDTDIVSAPALLWEWDHLLRTNIQFLAHFTNDSGLTNLRNNIGTIHREMVKRNTSIMQVAKARGIRPVPVPLHLWSSVGGVGKSTFVVKKLVPALHPVLGSGPGSETWLKLSNENKYFPPTGQYSKITVVDEFLTNSECDPVLSHLNGMVSSTPYYLDSAFEKNQVFLSQAIILMSNIPGCNVAGEHLRLNDQAAVAMWSRLFQFEVVNISRPLDQRVYERPFDRREDFSDLRFLPGNYIPERLNEKREYPSPEYSEEVVERMSPTNSCWVPVQLEGKWELTVDELMDWYIRQLRRNMHEFNSHAVQSKQKMVRQSMEVDQVDIQILKEPFEMKEVSSWNSLPQSERILRESYRYAPLFTQLMTDLNLKLEGLKDQPNVSQLDKDVYLFNVAEYIANQHSASLTRKIVEIDLESTHASINDMIHLMSLVLVSKVNIWLDGKYYLSTPIAIAEGEIWLKGHYKYWAIRPEDRREGDGKTQYSGTSRVSVVRSSKEEPVEPNHSYRMSDFSFQGPKIVKLEQGCDSKQGTISVKTGSSTPSKKSQGSDVEVDLGFDLEWTRHRFMNWYVSKKPEEQEAYFQLYQSLVKVHTDPQVLSALHNVLHMCAMYHGLQTNRNFECPDEDFIMLKWINIFVDEGEQEEDPSHTDVLYRDVEWSSQQMPVEREEDDFEEPVEFVDEILMQNAVQNLYTEPLELEPVLSEGTRMAVLMYGAPGAGKSTLAGQFARTLARLSGMEVIKCSTIWWSSLNMKEFKRVCETPKIFLSDDSFINQHYISLYDNSHPESLFINTTNQMVVEATAWEKFNTVGRFGSFVENTVKRLTSFTSSVKRFENFAAFHNVVEDGFVRRTGLSGHVIHGKEKLEIPWTNNMTFLVKGKLPYLLTREGYVGMSPVQSFKKFFCQFNGFLKANGRITFQKVTNHAEIVGLLNGNYRTPDIYIKAKTLKELQQMLSTPRSILRHFVTKMGNRGNFIYCSPQLMSDPNLSVTSPENFLVSVQGAMTERDLVDQGLRMYNIIALGASDPAIRVSVGQYDVYCFRKVIYTSDLEVELPIIHEILATGVTLEYSNITYRLSLEETFEILTRDQITLPQEHPAWVLKHLRINRGEIIQHPLFVPMQIEQQRRQGLIDYMATESRSFSDVIKSLVDSPYWKILKIAAGIASIALAVGTFWKFCQVNKKEQFDDVTTDDDESDVEAQSYEVNVKGKREKRSRIKAGKRGDRGGFGNRTYKHAQMVRGMQSVADQEIQPGNFEAIVSKIENAICQITIKLPGRISTQAYGLMIGGREVICPAHYFPRKFENKFDKFKVDWFSLQTMENDEIQTYPLRIKSFQRKQELILLEVPESVKQFQLKKDIVRYMMDECTDSRGSSGFMMVHQGNAIDRYEGLFNYILQAECPLMADDISTPDYVRVQWVQADFSTKFGHCGLPYLQRVDHEKILCGLHVAGSQKGSYGLMLTKQRIENLRNHTKINVQSKDFQNPWPIDFEMYPELIGLEEVPEAEWMLNLAKDIDSPVVMTKYISDYMAELTHRVLVPQLIRESKDHHILGFVPAFKGVLHTKLKKEISPFSIIAYEEGMSNTKFPSITSHIGAPDEFLTTLVNEEGKPVRTSVMWKQMEKMVSDHVMSSEVIGVVKMICKKLTPRFKAIYSVEQHRFLNEFEILNGIQYGPFKGGTEGMDRTASPGLPWTRLHNAQSKAMYVGLHKTQSGSLCKVWNLNKQTAELLDQIECCNQALIDGYIPVMLFKGSMKSELVERSKARLFCAGSIENQYLSTKAFGTFAAAVKQNYDKAETQIGVDSIRTLSKLWQRLMDIEGLNLCLDYKKFDKLLPLQLMLAVRDMILDIVESNFKIPSTMNAEAVHRFLKGIFSINIIHVVAIEGVVLYCTRGHPSGSFFTTILNSFCNIILFYSAFHFWTEQHALSSTLWKNLATSVDMGVYGDDIVVRVSDSVITRGLSYEILKELIEKHFGMQLTPASKEATEAGFVPCEGSEFISRTPAIVNGSGVILNRLKKVSIEHLWHWISTGKGQKEEFMLSNVREIMLEATLWGEDYYNKHLEIARITIGEALRLRWTTYVAYVEALPDYGTAYELLEHELIKSIANCSMESKFVTAKLRVLHDLKQKKFRENNKVSSLLAQESKFPRSNIEDTSIKYNCSSSKNRDISSSGEERGLHTISGKSQQMLPERWLSTPFTGDLRRTLWYEHLAIVIKYFQIFQQENSVVILLGDGEYQILKQIGTEKDLDGIRYIEADPGLRYTRYMLSVVRQLADSEHIEKSVNVLPSVVQKVNQILADPSNQMYVKVERDDRTSKVQYVLAMKQSQGYTGALVEDPTGPEVIPSLKLRLTMKEQQMPKLAVKQHMQQHMHNTGRIMVLNDLINFEERLAKLQAEVSESEYFEAQEEIAQLFQEVMNPKFEQPGMSTLSPTPIAVVPPGILRSPISPRVKRQSEEAKKVDKMTRKVQRSLFPRKEVRFLEKQQQSGSEVGHTGPTPDAQAPPPAPSEVMAQVANQEDNTNMVLASLAAQNRFREGGGLTNVTSAMMESWFDVNTGGGPIISVPTTTPLGTQLFKGNMIDMLNDVHKAYAFMHDRMYLQVEVLINFIGTATWAGNVRVAVLPTEIPTTYTVQEASNYVRQFKWEQKSLASNGPIKVVLTRLINSSQTNVAWDTKETLANSTGPYLYIHLVTGYEQALKNDDTSFQIQLMSRLGEESAFSIIDMGVVSRYLGALVPGSTTTTNVSNDLSRFAGQSFIDFLRNVCGLDLPTVDIVTNGSTYRDYDYEWEYTDSSYQRGDAMIRDGSYGVLVTTYYANEMRMTVLPKYWTNYGDLGTYNRFTSVGWLNSVPSTIAGDWAGVGWVSFSGFTIKFLETVRQFCNGWDVADKSGKMPFGWYQTQRGFRFEGETLNILQHASDYHSRFEDFLINQGYEVTRLGNDAAIYVLVSGARYNIPLDEQNLGRRYRVKRENQVDEFALIQINWYQERLAPDSWVIGMEDPNPSFETAIQVNQGSLLPSGHRGIDFFYKTLPVNNPTFIPVAGTRISEQVLRFVKDRVPEDYSTIIQVSSRVTNMVAFNLIINPSYNRIIIYFGQTQEGKLHALYKGAPVDQLRIDNFRILQNINRVPSSDPALWIDIGINGGNVSQIQKEIAFSRRVKKDTVQELRQLLKEARSLVRNHSKSQQMGITSHLQRAPRQLRVGQGWQEDKSTIGMIATGPVGIASKLAGSVGKVGFKFGNTGLGKSTGAVPLNQRSGVQRTPRNRQSATTPVTQQQQTTPNPDLTASGLTEVASSSYSPSRGLVSVEDSAPTSESTGSRRSSVDSIASNWSFGTDISGRGTILTEAVNRRVSRQQQDTGPPSTSTSHSNPGSFVLSSDYLQRRQRLMARGQQQRITGKQQQGGIFSSSIEGGINAGLQSQQAQFDKEILAQQIQGALTQLAAEYGYKIDFQKLVGSQGLEQIGAQGGEALKQIQATGEQQGKLQEQAFRLSEQQQMNQLNRAGYITQGMAGLGRPTTIISSH